MVEGHHSHDNYFRIIVKQSGPGFGVYFFQSVSHCVVRTTGVDKPKGTPSDRAELIENLSRQSVALQEGEFFSTNFPSPKGWEFWPLFKHSLAFSTLRGCLLGRIVPISL